MRCNLLIAVACSLLVMGCDSTDAVTTPVNELAPSPAKTLQEIDSVAYHSNIEAAMKEVPPEIKGNFQKLFICEVRRNNLQQYPRPVDADYIRALTAHLKANPTAGDNCAA